MVMIKVLRITLSSLINTQPPLFYLSFGEVPPHLDVDRQWVLNFGNCGDFWRRVHANLTRSDQASGR